MLYRSKIDPASHTRVLAVAADLGVKAIDLLPDFTNHPFPESLFPYEEGRHLVKTRGLHYNGEGHRLVAQRIVDRIPAESSGPKATSGALALPPQGGTPPGTMRRLP